MGWYISFGIEEFTMSQIILRPVFNRPEMLQLSFEYEINARNYYNFSDNLITVFLIEHGSPQKTLDLVEKYPFEKKTIVRTEKFGLSKNILLGMKEAFELADNFVIHLEDDILIHKTYFKFMDVLLNMKELGKFSVLSAYNFNDGGNVNEVYRGQHYAALAPLITKKFFMNYVIHCITPVYYENYASRDRFVRALGKRYENNKLYKYRNNPEVHNEQSGLINKIVDIALIEEGMAVIQPKINRQIHVGYYGKNRPGGTIPGNTFEEKFENLKEIIKSADRMYKLSKTPQYNDYKIFSPKLEEWDGTLCLKQ
jgi:hypothetical protein